MKTFKLLLITTILFWFASSISGQNKKLGIALGIGSTTGFIGAEYHLPFGDFEISPAVGISTHLQSSAWDKIGFIPIIHIGISEYYNFNEKSAIFLDEALLINWAYDYRTSGGDVYDKEYYHYLVIVGGYRYSFNNTFYFKLGTGFTFRVSKRTTNAGKYGGFLNGTIGFNLF